MNSATAKATAGQPYKLEVSARGHVVVSDVPLKLGGKNTGMTPHEMFLGSIAACIVDTLWMYCVRHSWDLKGAISVTITETEVEHPSKPGQKIPHFKEHVEVPDSLTQAQQQRLLSLVPKCPVHKLFTGEKLTEATIAAVAPPATP